MLWGITWSILAITVIIPHFNAAHQYPYWYDGGAAGVGAGHHSLTALLGQVTSGHRQKLETTAMILLPVAFLALRSPLALVAVPSLALRFLSTNSYFWGTAWHYNATVMPIVFIAAIDGLARIRETRATAGRSGPDTRGGDRPVQPSGHAGHRGGAGLPLPAGRPLELTDILADQHVRAEDAAMATVPDGATVEATLTMLAPLAARADTYWIGTSPNPPVQYIVFDESDSGWNPAPQNVLTFIEQRHPGVSYQQVFLTDDVYVFRRS